MSGVKFITDAQGRELHVLEGVVIATTDPEDRWLVGQRLEDL